MALNGNLEPWDAYKKYFPLKVLMALTSLNGGHAKQQQQILLKNTHQLKITGDNHKTKQYTVHRELLHPYVVIQHIINLSLSWGAAFSHSPGMRQAKKMVYPRKGLPWASKSVHSQTNPSSIYLSYAFYCIVSYSSVLPLSLPSLLLFLPLQCSVPLTLPYFSALSSASHDALSENQKMESSNQKKNVMQLPNMLKFDG